MAAVPEAAGNDFVVLQPGSTVATALVEGEARPKHVALLSVCGDQWSMTPLPLRTVRPFVIGETVLKEHEEEHDLHDENGLVAFLANYRLLNQNQFEGLTYRDSPGTGTGNKW